MPLGVLPSESESSEKETGGCLRLVRRLFPEVLSRANILRGSHLTPSTGICVS